MQSEIQQQKPQPKRNIKKYLFLGLESIIALIFTFFLFFGFTIATGLGGLNERSLLFGGGIIILWVGLIYVNKKQFKYKTLYFIALAIIVFLVNFSPEIIQRIDEIYTNSGIKISDFNDKPLISAKGNMIGLRITYSIKYRNDTETTGFGPDIEISPQESVFDKTHMGFHLFFLEDNNSILPDPAWHSIGRWKTPTFLSGQRYLVSVDVYPGYINFFPAGYGNFPATYLYMHDLDQKNSVALCISQKRFKELGEPDVFGKYIKGDEPVAYKVYISNKYFTFTTLNKYKPSEFYGGLIKEGLEDCNKIYINL